MVPHKEAVLRWIRVLAVLWVTGFFAYGLHITPKPTAGRRDDQRTLTNSGPAKINAELI